MANISYDYPGYERSGIRYWVKTVLLYGAVTLAAIWALAPFWWTLTTALAENPSSGLVVIFPKHPTLANFTIIFQQVPMGRWFLNSFIFAGVVTVFNLIFDSLAGFAFAKLDFYAREKLFLIFIGTMMLPAMVTMIPLFILLSELGWGNTYKGLIAPMIAKPFGIFLLRQHFMGLPDALGDAGRIDGCNQFQVFYHIYLPLTKPALSALGIFTFMFTWNNFEWPLIIATSEKMYTLPVALFTVQGQYKANWGLVMAAAVIIVIPPVLAFISAQKHFISGMTLSGFKG